MNKDLNKLQKLKKQIQEEVADEFSEIEEIEDVDIVVLPTELKPLNPRQMEFVEYYSISSNARQSAIDAGYSETSASVTGFKLLQMPQIQEAIKQSKIKFKQEIGITKKSILDDLIAFKEMSLSGEISATEGMRAIDIINKMLDFYSAQKLDVTTKSISINYIIPEDNNDDR